MYSYATLKQEEKEKAEKVAKDMIPEEAELLLLSFTGGRAFGWGGEHHDIDIHGFFAYDDDWFFKCHSSNRGFDMTLQNVYSVEEPEIRWGRWKQYYDKSNPIYTHEDFDIEKDFIDKCEKKYVEHIFPYDLHLQFSRMDVDFSIRSALHTYKEMLIPLYYLEHNTIESDIINVINQHEDYQYEELNKCGLKYSREDTSVNPDEEKIWEELEEIYWRLADMIDEVTGNIDRSEIHGPPMPSKNIPGVDE